jgi:indole-3-glycerol phosphate synthase
MQDIVRLRSANDMIAALEALLAQLAARLPTARVVLCSLFDQGLATGPQRANLQRFNRLLPSVAARAAASLPALRKDFLVDPYQVLEARALGADAVLVILAACDDALALDLTQTARALGMDVLAEVHDADELARALRLPTPLIGINNRSLRTFETRLETFETLAADVPTEVLLVAESGIFTRADIDRLARAGAGAYLIGESLMRQDDVAAAVAALAHAASA